MQVWGGLGAERWAAGGAAHGSHVPGTFPHQKPTPPRGLDPDLHREAESRPSMSWRRRAQAGEGRGPARAVSSQTAGQSSPEQGLDGNTSADSWLLAGFSTRGPCNLSEFPPLQKRGKSTFLVGLLSE